MVDVSVVAPTHGTVTISATGYTSRSASHGATATLSSVTSGTTVTLSCTMDAGYGFLWWKQGSYNISQNNPFSIEVTSTRTYTATEEFTGCIVSAVSPSHGTVTISSGGASTSASGGSTASLTVDSGASVSLSCAMSSSSYSFRWWKIGSTNISQSNPYTFTASQDVTYTATEQAVTRTITASATTGGSVSPSGSVSVTYGSNKTFTASPSSGYKFDHWVVDGYNGGSNMTYTFSNVTADHTIQAVFVQTNTVNVTAPTHGTVTISATGYTSQSASHGQTATLVVDTGTTVTLECTMDSGSDYSFWWWKIGSTNISQSNPFSVEITSDRTYVATERQTTFTITASATTGGTISPSGAVSVAEGGSQTFTATAETGYRFQHWLVDGQIEPDND